MMAKNPLQCLLKYKFTVNIRIMEYKVNIFGLKSLEPRMKGFIGDRNMYVLRDSKTGVALNTSFTEEGLK